MSIRHSNFGNMHFFDTLCLNCDVGGTLCLDGDVGGGLGLGSREGEGPLEDELEVEFDVVLVD